MPPAYDLALHRYQGLIKRALTDWDLLEEFNLSMSDDDSRCVGAAAFFPPAPFLLVWRASHDHTCAHIAQIPDTVSE